MEIKKLKNILEAVLLAAERSLTVIQLETIFELDEERPTRDEIRKALHEMADDFEVRGFELKQVASGFRLQVRQEYATWVGRLWEEKPARYTRALLETMALIAYRQPITRGEIEEVRGVSVSSNIIKTLLERDWIKVLGHKDVPGKPTLYGTTKEFLDYFNLQKLDQLPTLAEIKDLDSIHPELQLDEDITEGSDSSEAGDTGQNEGIQPSDDDNEVQSSTDTDEDLQGEDETVEAVEHVTAEMDEDVEQESDDKDAESTRPAFNV
ncbi:MAG: SMC-Scp complex subunit ScpB [Proteobacteria bacterium]|nr:SMC-Scp complex subunit ScpB [Pseudomonadota bacterium]